MVLNLRPLEEVEEVEEVAEVEELPERQGIARLSELRRMLGLRLMQ